MNVRVVIEKFLQKPELISETYAVENEYYFRYAGHAFSIRRHYDAGTTDYVFYVYPGCNYGLREIDEAATYSADDVRIVRYETGENKDIFARLFKLLEERTLGIPDIFKDVMDS